MFVRYSIIYLYKYLCILYSDFQHSLKMLWEKEYMDGLLWILFYEEMYTNSYICIFFANAIVS